MLPTKNAKSAGLRVGIIRAISTPLGFYVLSLLIVEATIGLVLTASKLSEDHVWWGLLVVIGLFLLVFLVVTGRKSPMTTNSPHHTWSSLSLDAVSTSPMVASTISNDKT